MKLYFDKKNKIKNKNWFFIFFFGLEMEDCWSWAVERSRWECKWKEVQGKWRPNNSFKV